MEEVIKTALADALAELGISDLDFVVEHPADVANGDYATNAALVAARQLGRTPREVAAELQAALLEQIEYVERIEVAGPGFINFYLVRDFFTAELKRALEAGERWGTNQALKEAVLLIEYTSPNLFKPLHIGNLVGNITGEALSRLAEAGGATVHRINYPSDIGLTVAKGVWGLKSTGADPSDISAIGEAYRYGNEMYEAGGVQKEEIDAVNVALYRGNDQELNALRAAGLATSKARLDELCQRLGTTFDLVITESEASQPGLEIVREHTGSVFLESEGAVIYPGERDGLHTRVFVNAKGLPTYEAKDLGNFVQKRAAYPDWTHSIIVTGNEQSEYFKVLYAAIRAVFPEAGKRTLEHIPTGFLTLTTGKMSSRKGNVLTGESLLTEVEAAARERAAETRADDLGELASAVAVAALKYQILRHNLGANIVFDKERALSFEGDSGPYLQYTYARILSVLEKAAEVGVVPDLRQATEVAYPIERILYRYPEVVRSAWQERAPQQLVGFLLDVAATFNTFYSDERIADASDEAAPYKAAVAAAVAETLKNGLWILGIKAPMRM